MAPSIGPVRALLCAACSVGFHPANLDPLFRDFCPPCAAMMSTVARGCRGCGMPRLTPLDYYFRVNCRQCRRDETDVMRAITILGSADPLAVAGRVRRLGHSRVQAITAALFLRGQVRLTRMGGGVAAEVCA